MKYIGIDPGAQGCIAVIHEGGAVVTFKYDPAIWRSVLQDLSFHDCVAVLEEVHSYTAQGVKSIFTFGRKFGQIEEMLDGNNIPYTEVPPQKWKKEFGIDIGRGATKQQKKDASINKCRELFPKVNLYRTERCTTPDDGIAEAVLIAEYCRRHYG